MARPGLLLLAYLTPFSFFLDYGLANEMKESTLRMLPVYAMLANADLLNSTQCGKELKDFRKAIDQRISWSLKVIDASGVPMSGFIYGNNYWLGSKSQCEDANNKSPFPLEEKKVRKYSKYYRVEDEFPPYEVKYFVANFLHNSTLQYHIRELEDYLIILGMCLPASCSKDQLSILLETVFKNRTLLMGQLYSTDFTLIEVKDLIDDHRWLLNKTFITMTIIVVLTFLLMIIGTTYDFLIYQKRLKKYYKYFQTNNERINNNLIDNKLALREDISDEDLKKLKYQSFLCKVFHAFSVYSNTKIIFSQETNKNSLPIIHGLKFLSMAWIVYGHSYYYMLDYMDNQMTALRISEKFISQLITNVVLAVDTFFFLSGFLFVYTNLKNRICEDERKPYNYLNAMKLYFLIVLKRFLRLTPTYMIVIGLVQINATWYSKTSLFYMKERPHETCSKYWWRNILYIQNLFGLQEMCMSWSWYLAADMQFFLITSFLLVLSSMYFKVAASLLGLLFISSTILTGYIVYLYDFIPIFDKLYNLVDKLYYPSWVRIGPYFVGVITAYIFVKLKDKLKFEKKTVILFWIIGSFCNLSVLFGLYQKRISILATAFYYALGRTVWAIGIAWLLIACCTNNGGILNRILSLKVWIPLNRLTYVVYLINPILISSTYLYGETSGHIDIVTNMLSYMGYMIIIYICSYVFSLMFEIPYYILIREIFNYFSKKI